jgi:hypothetical protein
VLKQPPLDPHLPIEKLAACFNKTVATYKFYWLLSIIEAVESGKSVIKKRELFARMICNAWYPINYFHLSFGFQDNIQTAIHVIGNEEKIGIDLRKEEILKIIMASDNMITLDQLNHFNNQVPHWFLSPWFPRKTKTEIYNGSRNPVIQCLYQLENDVILINLLWQNYIIRNAAVLKDFCYWNLALFLQSKNPSVPDIPNKIVKPANRSSLIKQRRNFWDIVLDERGSIPCIYTEKSLIKNEYAVDHFIPYNFVSHDLIWNLIPADKSYNSVKTDKLPSMEKHFDAFFSNHMEAFRIVRNKNPNNKFLFDYLTIFPNLNEMENEDKNITKQKFTDAVQPLIMIAYNNGFTFL